MQIAAAYVFGVSVIEHGIQAHYHFNMGPDMISYTATNILRSNRSLFCTDRHEPIAWRGMEILDYGFYTESINEYTVAVAAIPIDANRLFESTDPVLEMVELVTAAIPDLKGRSIGKTGQRRHPIVALYLEPQEKEERDVLAQEAQQSLWRRLGQPDAHVLKDLIIVNLGSVLANRALYAIRTEPLSRLGNRDDCFHVSQTFVRYLHFLAAIDTAFDIASTLRAQPFMASDLAEYLRSFSGTDQLRTYQDQFLPDRVACSDKLDKASTAIGTIEEDDAVVDTLSSLLGDNSHTIYMFPNSPYVYDPCDQDERHYRSAVSDSKRQMQLLRDRQAIVGDYLRDSSTISATDVNLTLNQSVRRLTMLAVALAIIGLILSIITDSEKATMHCRLFPFLCSQPTYDTQSHLQ
jgi:hypothetical protein